MFKKILSLMKIFFDWPVDIVADGGDVVVGGDNVVADGFVSWAVVPVANEIYIVYIIFNHFGQRHSIITASVWMSFL